jgi:transcriptional antiterminator RfaH
LTSLYSSGCKKRLLASAIAISETNRHLKIIDTVSQFTSGWYVLYTRPQHEKKVAVRLSDAGINYFLPLKKTLRNWHDRKKYIDAPVFPSYIFVYLNSGQDYYTGLHIEGVLYYVRYGREIARVSDEIIEDIRMVIELGDDIEVSGDHFQPGQHLVIQQGIFTGYRCEIVEFKRQKRFLLRLNILQRNILVSLPSEYLTAVSA